MKTLVAVYDDIEKARRVVEELREANYDPADIGLVVLDREGQYSNYLNNNPVHSDAHDVDAKEGAAFGAAAGGLTGLLVGLAALAIPGVGPVLAAGPVAAALLGGAVGAAAGAATGSIVAGLVDLGVPQDEAGIYAEAVRRGGAMVVLKARDDATDNAIAIMRGHSPVDLESSAQRWREQGWAGFAEEPVANLPAYNREDLISPERYDILHAVHIHTYPRMH